MAPKRSARAPPPPPPVASSEETDSGSGSEGEEEIAHSPPPAALKMIAPPPPQDQEESEGSDEEEDGEEEEGDEGEDGEEEEEGDEEEEDEKTNHVIPSSATNNPPPTREGSETSDDEEEESDDDVPQANPAPNQETVVANGAKPPSAPFQRTWSTDDEVRILEALAAHRQEHGTLPRTEELADAIAGKLDNSGCSLSELKSKVRSLQSKHTKAVSRGAPPSKEEDRRLFDLGQNVWPSDTSAAANGGAGSGRDAEEMCELYPYLAEEVMEIQKEHPGLFKRAFEMIDDSKARVMNERIKKHRCAQMNLHLHRHDLMKAVVKTLMDLDD